MYEQQPDNTWERQPLQPRIYLASLADYNAGHLHGAWRPADQSVDDLQEQAQAMLAASPLPGAEE